MSKVNTDAIKPRDTGLDITLGATGDTTVISADSINANTVKDSGGNTLWTSDGSGNLSSVNSQLKGSEVLILSQTASNSASVSFTANIDSTYNVYIFRCIAINPATDAQMFRFNASSDGGSNYNVVKTTTYFSAEHNEIDTSAGITYETGYDLAQSADPQILARETGNESDENCSGELILFNPASTTYLKHFYATFNNYFYTGFTMNSFIGGYLNTASAIDAIQFTVASGNFDGKIKMYGMSTT